MSDYHWLQWELDPRLSGLATICFRQLAILATMREKSTADVPE